MPAVNPNKLKKLLIAELVTPLAMRRGLSHGQLTDLVERAMLDPRFDLAAASDDFAGHMSDAEAADWVLELEQSNEAPHLFTRRDAEPSAGDERFGGYTKQELEQMSPGQALRILNQVEFEKAKKKC
jgi:hypothetical protein